MILLPVRIHVITSRNKLAERAESVVERDDDQASEGRQHAAVVSISGAHLVRFAVNEDEDGKESRVVCV